MQASTSGLFVHITHDNSDGTDLRLNEARVFLAELHAAVAQTETRHLEATAPVGRDVAGPEPEAEPEPKPAAKPKAKPRKKS